MAWSDWVKDGPGGMYPELDATVGKAAAGSAKWSGSGGYTMHRPVSVSSYVVEFWAYSSVNYSYVGMGIGNASSHTSDFSEKCSAGWTKFRVTIWYDSVAGTWRRKEEYSVNGTTWTLTSDGSTTRTLPDLSSGALLYVWGTSSSGTVYVDDIAFYSL